MVRPAFLPLVKDARPTRIDALCLVLITFLSAAPYVWRLGFYSDDWNFLAGFRFDEIEDRFGLASILTNESFRPRPFQGLYLGGLYKLFGLHPLGDHLVNTSVLAASVLLFHSLLLRLKFSVPGAFLATLILILLPQLSTVRVWYSVFQIPLSMAFALGSMHFLLTYLGSGRVKWAIAALGTAFLSIASYEIFAPLLLAFAFAVSWLRGRSGSDVGRPQWRSFLPIGALGALVAVAALTKAMLSSRVRQPDLTVYWKGLIQLLRPDYDWRVDYGLNVFAALSVHFWHPLIGWAKALANLLSPHLMPAALMTAAAVAGLTYWRVRTTTPAGRTGDTGPMLLMGATTFALGHATFLLVPDIMFSPSGMANRALVAAAPGVALIFAAMLMFLCRRIGSSRLLLAGCAAVLAFLGTYRISETARYWAEVPSIQTQILDAARRDLRDLPGDATVILDGVCPYHGPAIVFEAAPDVTGALRLALGRAVHGDSASNRAALTAEGLRTSIYGESATYRFGRRLYVYDPRRGQVVALTDERAARRYFADRSREQLRCPRGYVGQGSLI